MREQPRLIDYAFWLMIVLFLDPGGFIQEAIPIRAFKTLIIPLTWVMMIIKSNWQPLQLIRQDIMLMKIAKFLALWYVLYFFGVYLFLNDVNSDLSFVGKLVKTRISLLAWTMIIPVYYFTCYASLKVFIRLFVITTTMVSAGLVLKFAFGLDTVQVAQMPRGFINIDRYLLRGFGLIELGLYLLVALSIVPKEYFSGNRVSILIGSLAAYLIYVLSLTRRYFLYIIIAWGLGHFISRFIFQRGILKTRVLVTTIVVLLVSAFTINEYLQGVIQSFETLSFDQKSSFGTTAVRLSLFEFEPIIDKISESPFIGTGYMNGWYTNEVDVIGTADPLKGADFVFLASIGMFGFVGILLFVPFYVFVTKTILSSFKYLKNNRLIIAANTSQFWPYLIIFLATSIFFLRHLLTYPNWFSFIGPNGVFEKYYILVGLLLGCSFRIYLNVRRIKSSSSIAK